jgi:myo-inositol-1(or 4)-monophosphatase
VAEHDLQSLAQLAEDVARAAGDLLRRGLDDRRVDVSTKSSATDMVSEMDRASEALIVERLLDARPDDTVLAEEGGERAGSSGVRWVVDPLDGTTNYLYAHPCWGVSIAAEIEDETVAAAVGDPVLDEVFTAFKGGGAFLNGEPITHSGQTDLSDSLLATGFSYSSDFRREQAKLLVTVIPEVRDIRRRGSAALDLCWVGCGRVDAYYEIHLQPWDIAAGTLVAAEAGASVMGIDGGPASAASVVAAAPDLAAALLRLLADAGALSLEPPPPTTTA